MVSQTKRSSSGVRSSYLREVSPAEVQITTRGAVAKIRCKCGQEEAWTINGSLPPADIVRRYFVKRNWSMANKPSCPQCNTKRRIKPEESGHIETEEKQSAVATPTVSTAAPGPAAELKTAPANNAETQSGSRPVEAARTNEIHTEHKTMNTAPKLSAVSSATRAAAHNLTREAVQKAGANGNSTPKAKDEGVQLPSPAARAMRLKVIEELREAYDIGAERYREGFDDAAIAILASCPEALVAKIREEFYGPMSPPIPPEIEEIVESMGRLGKSIDELAKQIAEKQVQHDRLNDRLEKLMAKHGWAI